MFSPLTHCERSTPHSLRALHAYTFSPYSRSTRTRTFSPHSLRALHTYTFSPHSLLARPPAAQVPRTRSLHCHAQAVRPAQRRRRRELPQRARRRREQLLWILRRWGGQRGRAELGWAGEVRGPGRDPAAQFESQVKKGARQKFSSPLSTPNPPPAERQDGHGQQAAQPRQHDAAQHARAAHPLREV
jgi:hypothetical protein